MVNTIVVHSAREGAGKSTIAANIATLLACEGQRVGIIDADLQSGNLRTLFEFESSQVNCTLNDYFFAGCEAKLAIYDVSPKLHLPRDGRIFLVPSSSVFNDKDWEQQRECYDIEVLIDKMYSLAEQGKFDTLVIDTHSILNDGTIFSMLSMAIADVLAIVLKLDQRDYQSTGVVIDVANSLSVPKIMLIPNQVASSFDMFEVQQQIYAAYKRDVAAVIPYTDEIMLMSMASIFVLQYPHHPVTAIFHALSKTLQTKAIVTK